MLPGRVPHWRKLNFLGRIVWVLSAVLEVDSPVGAQSRTRQPQHLFDRNQFHLLIPARHRQCLQVELGVRLQDPTRPRLPIKWKKIYVARSVREYRVAPTEFCAQAKTEKPV